MQNGSSNLCANKKWGFYSGTASAAKTQHTGQNNFWGF